MVKDQVVPGGTFSTFSSLVSSHLELVATDVHAAPPSGAFLARVKKMNDTRFAFANARRLRFREKICRGIDDRLPEVGGLTRLEQRFPNHNPVSFVK